MLFIKRILPTLLNTTPLLLLFLTFGISNNSISQEIEKTYIIGELVVNSKDEALSDPFYEVIVEEIIYDQINSLLEKKGFDLKEKNNLLKMVADDQAKFMAKVGNEDIIREDKEKKTTADRVEAYGGSRFAEELTSKNNIKNGKIPFTYAKIADDIVFKWFTSPKSAKLLETNEFNIIGISVKLDELKRKIYTSLVLGNFKTFNEGPKFISNLSVPYSEKTYGLIAEDPIYCKKILKDENLMDLQKGLSVEGNAIYFETNNLRTFKKLIDKKKDGLAVDILQKQQFSCASPNIVDHNLMNDGILTKRIFSDKLFKNNLATQNDSNIEFRTQLAMLPEGISDGYELNLVIIKNKSICKTIPQNFLIETTGTYTKKVKLLADTVTINSKFQYKPIADSMQLSLRIPFENKKYTYQTQDIEPFLKLLNEPAFTIYDLQITAYSSIEGTDNENKILQQKRAESIIKALEGRQNNLMKTRIITEYNWTDFQTDIQKNQHNIMASMTLEEAQSYIRNYNLNKELEPLLASHRYAQIDMKVTFDISGENEPPYVLKKFHNAIAAGDKIMALSIQKFILKQILNYNYKPDILNKLEIPANKEYAGMIMNKIWLQYYTKQISQQDFIAGINNLYQINPGNEYIAFNCLFMKITEESLTSSDEATLIQNRIDRLYNTPLKKETIDALNIKFQFKVINYADSVANDLKLKEVCINRMKQIIDINDETLQNSLKLAELFIENNDYSFALKTLETWIFHPNVSEELLFAYVSLCSRDEMNMHTQKFNFAMNKCQELNQKRFCELLNGDYFSLRVFENQFVKESYCKNCSTETKMVLE